MAIEPQFLPSPKRYWLDAPHEEPHTCFVKDSDYAAMRAITTSLQLERDRYRNEASRLRKALEKIAHPEQGLRPQDKKPFLNGFVPLDRRIAMEALEPASALETEAVSSLDHAQRVGHACKHGMLGRCCACEDEACTRHGNKGCTHPFCTGID